MRVAVQRQCQSDGEGRDKTENEFRKTLPDFGQFRLFAACRDIDVIGPDIGENEGPDADEHVDEDFHRRRGRRYPARLVIYAFRRRLGDDNW